MTRLHHRWGAPEAEIFVLKFLPWPGLEPRTSQSNGRERKRKLQRHPDSCVSNNGFYLLLLLLLAATVPEIYQPLKSVTCVQGKSARFEAVITAQPTPEITWSV